MQKTIGDMAVSTVLEVFIEVGMLKEEEIKEWLLTYGADLNQVMAGSTVEVDYERRRIITEEYLTGPPKIDQLVRVKGHRCFEDAGMIYIRRIHQHEAAIKLPDGIEEWRITEVR